MKNLILSIFLISCFVVTVFAQEQTPATEAGEDFDLQGVIGLFEESKDIEDFEKKINDEKNDVNNLDLNKDGEVDLVKVVQYKEFNTNLLVLQAILSEKDVQDVATIEIEKHSENEISLQVIGDPDMYGADYIVEPAKEEGSILFYRPSAVFVSVHAWRPVRVIYTPGGVVFVSGCVWRPHPAWYHPYKPVARSSWRARCRRWHNPRVAHTRRRHSARARSMYSPRRRTSPAAKKNYGSKPAHYSSSPSNQQKKATTSPNSQNNKSSSPANTTSPNSQNNKSSSPANTTSPSQQPKKKKKH